MSNNTDTTLQKGEERDRTVLRRLELVAHATTTAAFLLTIYLVKSAYASEMNVVAESLFGTIGWAGTGVGAIVVIAVAFMLYDRHLETYPRLILGAGAMLALAGVLDLSVNLYILARMGFPETFWWEGYFPLYAPVAVVGVLALARHRIARRLEPFWSRVRETRQKYSSALSAIAIAMLIATSVVAVPFLGGIATDRADHNGTAEAAEIGAYIYGTTETGDYAGWSIDAGTRSVNWKDGYANEMTTLSVGPDGSRVALGVDGSGEALYMDHADNGSTIWSDTSYSVRPNPAMSYDGERVYVVSGSTVQARQADDGTEIWSTTAGTSTNRFGIGASPKGDIVLAGDWNGKVTAHDTSDGSVVWSDTSMSNDINEIEFGPDGDYVYVQSTGVTTTKYDASDGSIVWQKSTHPATSNSGSIAVESDYVWSAGDDGVKKLDPADGSELGSWLAGVSVSAVAVHPDNSNELVIGNGSALEGRDKSDGSVLWSDSDITTGDWRDIDMGARYDNTDPVTGRVTDKDGNSLENVAVGADHPDVESTTTNATGYYELAVPDPGTYDITADDGDYVQTKTVDVPDGGVSGVDFALGPGDPAGQSVGLLEDDHGFFPADDTELVVYERSTEYKSIEDGMSVDTWHETTWSETDRTTFNWENRTRVDLVDGRYYRLELVSSHGHWEDSGFLYNDTEMSGETIWLEPDTSSTDTNGDGTSGGDGSSGGDSWDDTGTPTPDENGDFPTATEQQGFGPTALGKCTTLDGQDGVEVEYWDPDYETAELEANLTTDDSTTYYIHKIWDDPRGYYRGCIADSMTDNASAEADVGLNHTALDGEGEVLTSGRQSFSAPTFGPSGKAPASTGERAGLLAAVLGALGVLWFGGNLYVPASSVKSWPSESISPAFGIGAPIVAVLGLDLAGGGVISAGVATGLAQIAPFAGIVGVTVGGYYALRWIRAPPAS